MLRISNLQSGYGASRVLFGVDLFVGEGEFVGLVGRNGMGKSTTIHTLFGIVPAESGSIEFRGQQLVGMSPTRIARLGLGLVPEGRRIFPKLTVRENLMATAANYSGSRDPWTLARVLEQFPSLAARLSNYGGQLSGGEQQMLAIGRALMINPRLLVLDEATEGLAPLIQRQIWSCLRALRQEGQSILIVDKNLNELRDTADRVYVMQNGQVVWSGDGARFGADPTVETYLAVAA